MDLGVDLGMDLGVEIGAEEDAAQGPRGQGVARRAAAGVNEFYPQPDPNPTPTRPSTRFAHSGVAHQAGQRSAAGVHGSLRAQAARDMPACHRPQASPAQLIQPTCPFPPS